MSCCYLGPHPQPLSAYVFMQAAIIYRCCLSAFAFSTGTNFAVATFRDSSPLQRSSDATTTSNNITTQLGPWPEAPFRYRVSGALCIDFILYGVRNVTVDHIEILAGIDQIERSISSGGKPEDLILPEADPFSSGLVEIGFEPEWGVGLRTVTRMQVCQVLRAVWRLTALDGPKEIAWAKIDVSGMVLSTFFVGFMVGDRS